MSNVRVVGSIEKDKHSLLSTRSSDNLEEKKKKKRGAISSEMCSTGRVGGVELEL